MSESKRWTEVLCTQCGGNGVIKIHHGTSVCPRCDGRCYEPEESPSPLAVPRQEEEPTREWLLKRCAWYSSELDRLNALLFQESKVSAGYPKKAGQDATERPALNTPSTPELAPLLVEGVDLEPLLIEACGMLKLLDRDAKYPSVTEFLARVKRLRLALKDVR